MSQQPPPSHARQQTSKSFHNQASQHTNSYLVRDTVRKFDTLGQTNDSHLSRPPPPPLPPLPPNLSRIPFTTSHKQTNSKDNSPTASLGSLSGSSGSELMVHSKSIEHKRLTPNGSSISRPKPSVPSSVSDQSTSSRRRPPPPVPAQSTSNGQKNRTYTHSDHKINENESESESPRAFKVFARPATVYSDRRVSSSVQTDDFDTPRTSPNNNNNNHRHQNERLLPPLVRYPENQRKNDDRSSIGLEIIDPAITNRRKVVINQNERNYRSDHVRRAPTIIEDYEIEEEEEEDENQDEFSPSSYRTSASPPPPPAFALSYRNQEQQSKSSPEIESEANERKRTLPLSNFMMEIGALLVVFIVCMILVLAIKADDISNSLPTTMSCVYIYIYVVSIIWMLWCTFDIIKYRQSWMKITGTAKDHEDYMVMIERNSKTMFYFPDIHNTGGLFMRIGAGLLCMGGLILTIVELAKTIATIDANGKTRDGFQKTYSTSGTITKAMAYIFRFLFHCVQFSFLFRYGNIVINRYHLIAKIGLIHVVIANFGTWFEAIVIETLEQMHKNPSNEHTSPTTSTIIAGTSIDFMTTTSSIDNNGSNGSVFHVIREASLSPYALVDENNSTLDILGAIEEKISVYLYPCLIEYSLISLTVFFIMWRNIGQTEKRSFLRFGARHIFTVNCARASRGLLIGGILFLLTILTLIPTYLLTSKDATTVTHITELVLLAVSLFTVLASYVHTTKLYYDRHAHVDVFDQVLIIITTIGDFAYSFFGLFAALLIDPEKSPTPIGIEISIGFLAIFQTFLQTNFIIDTLKRRTTTKHEIRSKPGRETVTALLLMNLAIWLHDSLSGKKVTLNPLQGTFYDVQTWAIIQAFSSPLSIFYRFHSSVCLADIWQEVYQDEDKADKYRLMNDNDKHNNKH